MLPMIGNRGGPGGSVADRGELRRNLAVSTDRPSLQIFKWVLKHGFISVLNKHDNCDFVSCSKWIEHETGFTKFNRADFTKLRQEKRVVPDGVNAKFLSCHGPLALRQPGSAFLPATY
ncbi:hypothetical protein F2Q70_00019906 [Brassica cretica]|uniref:Uncharacterized protein n=1 Tax=Brassica cretica TaxID=69181 RepID=A0A8S9GSE4_BRACR|nr:hypothetical protein F2Q70_00019906 [Brassica cretica]